MKSKEKENLINDTSSRKIYAFEFFALKVFMRSYYQVIACIAFCKNNYLALDDKRVYKMYFRHFQGTASCCLQHREGGDGQLLRYVPLNLQVVFRAISISLDF